MEGWSELTNLLMLLSAALLFGTVAERLKQSAIIGYLIAGMVIGPNVLGWVGAPSTIQVITELGAALFLFCIGLEFSFRKLVGFGGRTALLGFLQISVTWAAVAGVCVFLKWGAVAAVVMGAAVALSSTTVVFRALTDNAMMESLHGRATAGVLLLQDAAVVFIVLLISVMQGESSFSGTLLAFGKTVGACLLLFFLFYAVLNFVVPRVLNLRQWSRNRELPVLLAVVIAFGSAYLSHRAGISPAFGAFAAGMLLAESPFSTQIRADISTVRTVMVTLFFATVGMYANPVWIGGHLPL
ncbi:MAG TPA: cation:proton antiporter, partial [bacterium]|nr:cation:proton antiporter [bacterium]